MKKKNTSNRQLTKEQRLARRQAQVRKQKILLVFLVFSMVLLGIILAVLLNRRGPNPLEINAACEAYRPQVEEAAAQYGMSEYVDLILALMMQESSGIGPDVLQSSEGAYNTEYPQVPGGITDPSYSIQCGIQELKYAMEKAGVQSPTDMENIRLALQAYNFGADVYFSYMNENGNSIWTEESSEAFAQMASGGKQRDEDNPLRDPAGPWDYGDQKYPEHVLRYYHPEE
ncbi:MAG: lysozyme family protein [Eubacteriales bacterium]|nr:lysozyme family protein [Eubacteriales bacterium]